MLSCLVAILTSVSVLYTKDVSSEILEAQAHILKPNPLNNSTVTNIGLVRFIQAGGVVRVFGRIWDLEPGYHGFHIHNMGDIGDNCRAAGPHFNPTNQPHGGPLDSKRHVGDLGNIHVPDSRIAGISFLDDVISLTGSNSIIGRSVVVHERADDLGRGSSPESKTTGNAGGRVACGIIGIV